MDRRKVHFTEFILTRPYLFLAVLSLLVACESTDSHINQPQVAPVKASKSIAAPLEAPKEGLTDESVVSFLNQFAKSHQGDVVLIHTNIGDIKIQLYRNTPIHRANFTYLTQQEYFDGTWFYRVSPGHVIQAGNNDETVTGKKRRVLGDYKLPNEIAAGNLHVRGAIAAARTYYQNPDKLSNPYEFYIVIGKEYSSAQLELLAEKEGFDLNDKQREAYANQPGSPHLDAEHTVFGRVISGMETVMAISRVETDEGEWPLEIIPVKMKVIKD